MCWPPEDIATRREGGDIDDLRHMTTLPQPAHTDQPNRPGGAGQAGLCVARPGTFYHLKSVSKPGCDHLRPTRSGTYDDLRRSSMPAGGQNSNYVIEYHVKLPFCRLVNV